MPFIHLTGLSIHNIWMKDKKAAKTLLKWTQSARNKIKNKTKKIMQIKCKMIHDGLLYCACAHRCRTSFILSYGFGFCICMVGSYHSCRCYESKKKNKTTKIIVKHLQQQMSFCLTKAASKFGNAFVLVLSIRSFNFATIFFPQGHNFIHTPHCGWR